MKTQLTQSVLLTLMLLFCISELSAQRNMISGIVLEKETAQFFQSTNYKMITVAKDGTAKPIDGYKMFLNEKDGSILISKKNTEVERFKIQPLRKGVDFFCYGGCKEEGCEIEKVKKGVGSRRGVVQYDCLGCFKDGGGVEQCFGSLKIYKRYYLTLLK